MIQKKNKVKCFLGRDRRGEKGQEGHEKREKDRKEEEKIRNGNRKE